MDVKGRLKSLVSSLVKQINFRNGIFFTLGVILTIVLNKMSDRLIPNEPVVVKQMTDTLTVIHRYDLGSVSADSAKIKSLDMIFKDKIEKLSRLKQYEDQINEYIMEINKIQKNETRTYDSIPNPVVIVDSLGLKYKAYHLSNSLAFFKTDCPEVKADDKFIEIKLEFIDDQLVSQIAFLRAIIYGKEFISGKVSYSFVLDELYEPRPGVNLIKIVNELRRGSYELSFGFILKKDLNNKVLDFYRRTCNINITS